MKKRLLIVMMPIVAIAAYATNALAHRAYDDIYTYYSDASHTNVVGQTEYFCEGGSEHTGQTTSYYSVEHVAACYTIPCQPNGDGTTTCP